jgi:hypothetical protein
MPSWHEWGLFLLHFTSFAWKTSVLFRINSPQFYLQLSSASQCEFCDFLRCSQRCNLRFCLLGQKSAFVGNRISTFGWHVVPSLSGVDRSWCSTLYDNDSMFYRNVGIRLLINTASYSRRTEATIWIPFGLTVLCVSRLYCIDLRDNISIFKAKNDIAFETWTILPPSTRYYPETG